MSRPQPFSRAVLALIIVFAIGPIAIGPIAASGCAGGSDGQNENSNQNGNENENENGNDNPAVCGDGEANGDEECDGADLGGQTCEGLGHQGGTLTCYFSCTFDESGCHDNPCGNGTLDSGEACDDGNTQSGDGCSASCKLEAPRWIQASPATTPPARGQHALAYDEARQVVVLFGGTATMGQDQLGDTWEFDGLDWIPVTLTSSPPARFGYAMAYDAARQCVVLFGGAAASGGSTAFLSDTWEYSGASWTEVNPTESPPASAGHRLVYDAARQRVVLVTADFMGSGDTALWDFDGTTWTPLSPSGDLPPARGAHAAGYDADRDRLVLHGGSQSDGQSVTYLQDTWEYDAAGNDWDRVTTASIPPGRTDALVAFHGRRGHLVMFGGSTGVGEPPLLDTWEYDGQIWQNTHPDAAPPAPGAGAYDSLRGRIVLFGGCISTTSFTGCFDETWEMDYASY